MAEVDRALAACRALLALPFGRSGVDRRRREALRFAVASLEAGEDLSAALAAVREEYPVEGTDADRCP